MELEFKINGDSPEPHLGIIEGYILEGINQVPTIELVLVSPFSLSDATCADYIGKPVTLDMVGLVEERLKVSRFDGNIYEFHVLDEAGIEKGLNKYQMIVRPRLWDLNFFVRARSFPNRTRVDVVDEILAEHDFLTEHHYKAKYQNRKVYPRQVQLVQNQISDLVFLQSILKEAGINFFYAADKDGNKESFLKLTDNNIFFDDISWTVVPYIPNSGQNGGYKVETFETHYRAVPQKTIATNYLGDGKPQVFTAAHAIADGNIGTFHCFGTEGETCDVPKRAAMIGTQHFQSSRVLYEGRSNQFLFRPGEKFKIGDRYGKPNREVLMTSLFHHFHQTSASAVTGDNEVEYNNYFMGTQKPAEIRPDQTDTKTIVEMKRLFSSQHSVSRLLKDKQHESSDIDELEKQALIKRVSELKTELSLMKDLSGVMVGEVIEDAKVTPNNELVCIVNNEQFPDGITVKVALVWLSKHGWLSLLPRVGVQVYFQFIAGTGGQHEAVLLGYRPTSDHPLMNPVKNTESASLDPDDAEAVGEASFSPLNKHRNALMGESGVAEIAVVDGGEDSVYLKANNRVSMNGDKSVSIKTKSLREKAGDAHQQYGALTRSVSKNQKITIGGESIQTTKDVVKISSTDERIELYGKKELKLQDEKGGMLIIDEDRIRATEPAGNYFEIDPKTVKASSGKAMLTLDKNTLASLSLSKTTVDVSEKTVTLLAGPGNVVEISDSGKITVYSKEIEIVGKKLIMQGSDKATICDDKGGTIVTSGGEIKLNC